MNRFRVWICILMTASLLWGGYWNCIDAGSSVPAGTRPDQGAGRAGGVYRLPLLNSPSTLDPAYVHDIYAAAVVNQLFDGLVQFSSDLLVIPAIAENWRLEGGGKAYRFMLRKDARFHNGAPVTSADVRFSLLRLLRASPPPTILPHLLQIKGAKAYQEGRADDVEGLQAPTPETFVIQLDQPYVPILAALGMAHASIVPAAEATRSEFFGQHPVGSGPFQFEAWESNHEVRIKRYDDYYGGKSLLDGIRYVIYPGVTIEKVWADFRDRKLDEMPVYPRVSQNLKEIPDLKWLHRPSLSLLFYGINDKRAELKDLSLRHALTAAIDREKLNLQVYDGEYTPATSILPPGMPGYKPMTETERPKGTPAWEGKSVGEKTEGMTRIEVVSTSQSPLAQAEIALVGEAWRPLGVELSPKYIPDWAEFENYLRSDSVQLYRYAWFAEIPDPDGFLRVLFSSRSTVNYMRYADQETETLFQKAVGETDPVERVRLYQLAQKRILDACPVIPLLYLSVDHVYQPNVRGIELNVLGAHATSYLRVWLDDAQSK